MSSENKLSSYPMHKLAPIICEFLARGKNVIVPAKGNSMRPLLRNQKDSIVLTSYKGEPLCVGDAVFYRRSNGGYVLHRIVSLHQDGSFTLMGDNQCQPEKGITAEQIIAVPTAFIRGKKNILCSSVAYKKYVNFWTGSTFFRKLHMKLFFLLARIKSRIKNLIKAICV